MAAVMAQVGGSAPCTDDKFSLGFVFVGFCCAELGILTGAPTLPFGPQPISVGQGCSPRFPGELRGTA